MSRLDSVDTVQSSNEKMALASVLYIWGGQSDVAIQLHCKVT